MDNLQEYIKLDKKIIKQIKKEINELKNYKLSVVLDDCKLYIKDNTILLTTKYETIYNILIQDEMKEVLNKVVNSELNNNYSLEIEYLKNTKSEKRNKLDNSEKSYEISNNTRKKKNSIIAIVLIIIAIIIISVILFIVTNNKRQIKAVVTSYFDNIIENNYIEANQYLSSNYDYNDNPYLNSENIKIYLSKYDYEIKEITAKNDNAIVMIELKHPDISSILSEYSVYLSKNLFNSKVDEQEYKKTLLKSKDLEFITDMIQLALIKKQNQWFIQNDNNLKNMLILGGNYNFNSLTDNETNKQKYTEYIRDNLELLNFNVSYITKHDDKKIPAITNIEIKNKGNKIISELVLKIEFVDENNNIIATRTVEPISVITSNLKPNYSWKQDIEEYIEINNITDNINIERCNVTISDIEFGKDKNETLTAEQIYINDCMEILSYNIKEYTKYDKSILPGLGGLAIKNHGSKNLKKVYVTVYFQDENGNDIADNEILIIGGLFTDTNILKANYSWKMKDNEFYEITNLANEVDINRHTVKITNVEFEDE